MSNNGVHLPAASRLQVTPGVRPFALRRRTILHRLMAMPVICLAVLSLCCGKQPAGSNAQVVAVFDQGELYLYGNTEPPPYVLAVTDSALLINGVRVYPKIPSHQSPPVAVSQASSARFDLDVAAGALGGQLEHEGKSLDDINNALADFYRSSPLVSKVTDVRSRSFHIYWKGAGDEFEEHLLAPGRADSPPMRERIMAEARRCSTSFARGCSIVISSAEDLTAPRSHLSDGFTDIHDAIRRARTAEPADLASDNWHERPITLSMARQLRHPLTLSRTAVHR